MYYTISREIEGLDIANFSTGHSRAIFKKNPIGNQLLFPMEFLKIE